MSQLNITGDEIYKIAKEKGIVSIDRWADGVEHHPMSIKLMKFLSVHDFKDYNDHFGWSIGGDGDNGENLMYEMDAFFETLDIIDKKVD
jgi:hypothetical protein